MTYDMDMEYARQDAAADKARERAWKNYTHGGPEFWEDWMGNCQSCYCEECECEIEECPTCHSDDVEWDITTADTDRWAYCNKCGHTFKF